jgi:ABC-2 type transport system permease protein
MKVFRFELSSILNKKSVRVSTLIMSIFIFIASSIPTIINVFFPSDEEVNQNEMGLNASELGFTFISEDIQVKDFEIYLGDNLIVYNDEQSLRDAVIDGSILTGFLIEDAHSFTSIIQNKDMYGYATQNLTMILQRINRDRAFKANNIDPQVIDTLSNQPIVTNEEILGKDAQSSFLLAYILMFAVYMLVIMYGSFVSTSVAREKDSRTMEILITSTKPSALIIGKVFANAVGGLLQLSMILATGIVGYLLNQSNYPEVLRTMLFSGLSWDAIVTFALFSTIGYLLYLFLYASLGSLVSKVEDVGSAVTPITLLFIVAYAIATIGLNAPTNPAVKIGSFVPFTAIMAMPIRYFMTYVSLIDILISLTLMIVTTVLFAILSIKIYRLGSLSYGNKLSLVSAVKLILSKEDKKL